MEQDLTSLQERLKYAAANGFTVAHAQAYAAMLEEMGAPPATDLSAASLLNMVDALLNGTPKAVKSKIKKAAKKSAKQDPAPKLAAAPEPEAPKATEEAPLEMAPEPAAEAEASQPDKA